MEYILDFYFNFKLFFRLLPITEIRHFYEVKSSSLKLLGQFDPNLKGMVKSISADYRSNRSRVDMSLHSDILFWFRVNQSLLLLVNAGCLEEKQIIQSYSLWLDSTGSGTHDLPHHRRARQPLLHWCGWSYNVVLISSNVVPTIAELEIMNIWLRYQF